MDIEKNDTAVLLTDPQNDFLSEKGATWQLVGESVKNNKTVDNIEQLLKAAKKNDFQVFISPHYYYPTDGSWEFGGTVENMMKEIHMFERKGALETEGFDGSGADWLEQYKPYINDGKTVVTNPHKVYGPESNDLVLQLRKRRINKVILAGMSANLCLESHMRELVEQGFEVAVVKDATAAAQHPELGDGYATALVNFNFIANAVMTTEEATLAMGGS
jgi:nicotinamidase-related amidase